jgi:ribose transport system permease protein
VILGNQKYQPAKVATATISGLTAGIAAMVYLLGLNVGSPIAGIAYELNAIAAVIMGGTSLFGGRARSSGRWSTPANSWA